MFLFDDNILILILTASGTCLIIGMGDMNLH